jgi:FtsP/CotA-like multicopper oxidase with cupredoxin domain
MWRALALTVVVLAAGCGEGTGGGGIDNTETGTSSGADYELFASEFSFAPPFLVIEKAGTYSISIRNDGTVPHNFTIEGVGKTPDAQPGETVTAELTFKAGNFEFFCSIDDHAEQGMIGTLNVLG